MANKPNSLVVLPIKATYNTRHEYDTFKDAIVTSMKLPSDWSEYLKFETTLNSINLVKKGHYDTGGTIRKFYTGEYATYKYKVATEAREYIALKKAEKVATAEITERAKKVYDKFKAMFGENYHANGVLFEGERFSLTVNTSGTLYTDGGVKKFLNLSIRMRNRYDSSGLTIDENGNMSGRLVFSPTLMTATELMEYAEKVKVADDKFKRFAELMKDWAKIETPETNSVTA